MYSIGFHDGMEYGNEEASIVLCFHDGMEYGNEEAYIVLCFYNEWSMGMKL